VSLPNQLRHVYACLVHEGLDCVEDLIRNLRRLDPDSTVLLYNGSRDPAFLSSPRLDELGAATHPNPRPMAWGRLHDFAVDCMEHALGRFSFDLLTIVDSDQLLLRPGYVEFMASKIDLAGLGMLSTSPGRHGRESRHPTIRSAWQDLPRWRQWLMSFPRGLEYFVHWTFWPGTVFTREAARRVVQRFRSDRELARTLERCRLSVTEEVLLPTLVALLGLRVEKNPACQNWVRYRPYHSREDCEAALGTTDAFFLHPVARHLDDPGRQHLRDHYGY
jgi:hypothetical protein